MRLKSSHRAYRLDLSRGLGRTFFALKTGSHVRPATVFCQKLKIEYWRAILIQLPFIAAELPKARISPLKGGHGSGAWGEVKSTPSPRPKT